MVLEVFYLITGQKELLQMTISMKELLFLTNLIVEQMLSIINLESTRQQGLINCHQAQVGQKKKQIALWSFANNLISDSLWLLIDLLAAWKKSMIKDS